MPFCKPLFHAIFKLTFRSDLTCLWIEESYFVIHVNFVTYYYCHSTNKLPCYFVKEIMLEKLKLKVVSS